MGTQTAIAWTDHTFNVAWGCHKVSPGCDHCYAEELSTRRAGMSLWGPPKDTSRRTFGPAHWEEPLRWQRLAEKEGRRHRVFSSSMCDNFEAHPAVEAELRKLWPLIKQTPLLDWQLLTKRPERIRLSLPLDWAEGYPNVWLGTSVESQEWADLRIPRLLKVLAIVHFVSAEPLLAPLDLAPWLDKLGWIIVGGESGSAYRPMDHAWARSIRDACRQAGVPFFFKQSAARWTERGILLDGRMEREYPNGRSRPE